MVSGISGFQFAFVVLTIKVFDSQNLEKDKKNIEDKL